MNSTGSNQVKKLSAFHHYRYESDGLGIHFIHERGTGSAPLPLIVTHGWPEERGAYAHMQRTCPQTAAYGLNDSPAGLAACILEKFRESSDCDGDVYRRFSRDELLTNLTLYWMTETISSSFRMYYENQESAAGVRAR